ncbi:MAG: hypothetical protein WAL41_27920 [Mycobacterium sp.]
MPPDLYPSIREGGYPFDTERIPARPPATYTPRDRISHEPIETPRTPPVQEIVAPDSVLLPTAPLFPSAGSRVIQDDRMITKEGVRYIPRPLAAWLAHASETTLSSWIEKGAKFGGRSIKTYTSQTQTLYVSEESLHRMAQRFVKWPSNKPAGPVSIGETDHNNGFIGTADAARIIGVSTRTMWLWASQSKAPTDKPLDVIKCTTSEHFYIREKDVLQLKEVVPRSGLRRGRRPYHSMQP